MILADGQTWHFPRVDFSLIFAETELRSDLVEASRLAQATVGSKGFSQEVIKYQLHLLKLGHRLLEINYALDRDDIARLLRFKTLVEMTTFTLAVSIASYRSRAIWGSIEATSGRDLNQLN